MDNLTKECGLQTQMCLQILIQYGESTALVAILQAQNHKSEIGYDLSPDYTNIMHKGLGSGTGMGTGSGSPFAIVRALDGAYLPEHLQSQLQRIPVH